MTTRDPVSRPPHSTAGSGPASGACDPGGVSSLLQPLLCDRGSSVCSPRMQDNVMAPTLPQLQTRSFTVYKPHNRSGFGFLHLYSGYNQGIYPIGLLC